MNHRGGGEPKTYREPQGGGGGGMTMGGGGGGVRLLAQMRHQGL